ncbi:TPA: inovirus Gp2 family protein [Morganella morganii]|nr:inovirus Gp2 family protein [Morganella morganii]
MRFNMYSYNAEYRRLFEGVIDSAVTEFPRTLALRIDLRYPPDYVYDRSNREITRFIESLKARLCTDTDRKAQRWGRRLSHRLRYIWVREFGGVRHRKHYHLVLLLNKDIYHTAGRFNGEDSLAGMIQQAWCSALGLRTEYYACLVHFPEKGAMYLCYHNPDYTAQRALLVMRLDYLAKDHTKDYHDGYRSVGTSR